MGPKAVDWPIIWRVSVIPKSSYIHHRCMRLFHFFLSFFFFLGGGGIFYPNLQSILRIPDWNIISPHQPCIVCSVGAHVFLFSKCKQMFFPTHQPSEHCWGGGLMISFSCTRKEVWQGDKQLKVLGKSVGLCKTTKRKDQLYISLLVSVWRFICENFNPNGLILAEIWMKL